MRKSKPTQLTAPGSPRMSPSRCFSNSQQILKEISFNMFRFLLCRDAATVFTNTIVEFYIAKQSECKNKIDNRQGVLIIPKRKSKSLFEVD